MADEDTEGIEREVCGADMKLSFVLVFILMITLAVFPQKTENGRFAGKVTDTAGAVIPGVNVKASGADSKAFSTLTNNKGEYEISLPKGDYTLSYSGVKGFADRTMFGFVRAASFKDRYDVDTVLDTSLEGVMVTELTAVPEGTRPENPGRCFISRSDRLTLVGIVIDINQARIPDATISAAEKGGKVYSARSDSEGKYKLELPKGEYTVAFSRAFFGTVAFDLKVDQFSARSIDTLLEAQPQINVIEIPVKGTK